jgi:hypothetical protein
MKNFSKIVLIPLCMACLLVLLPNCAKYEPEHLRKPAGQTKKKQGIEITKYVFNEDDCLKYFDRKIVKKGYQPIQLFIKNNSNKTLFLKSDDITLPLVPVKNVSLKLHRDISWKITKYFLIGGPAWAALEGYRSHEVNKKIDADFVNKALSDKDIIKIKPNKICNRVMFVTKENYESHFDVTLTDKKSNNKIKFTV